MQWTCDKLWDLPITCRTKSPIGGGVWVARCGACHVCDTPHDAPHNAPHMVCLMPYNTPAVN